MRFLQLLFIAVLLCLPGSAFVKAQENQESIIIEVTGNPLEHKKYIETYHPFIEVIATYNKLFNGLALQGSPDDLEKMGTLDFVKAVHTVETYQTNRSETPLKVD